MLLRLSLAVRHLAWALAFIVCTLVWFAPISGMAQQKDAAKPYGIAAKRPVLQGACHNCPWGMLGDTIKKMMAPYGYDVVVCYTCSSDEGARIVSKRLVAPEITDRMFAEGTLTR